MNTQESISSLLRSPNVRTHPDVYQTENAILGGSCDFLGSASSSVQWEQLPLCKAQHTGNTQEREPHPSKSESGPRGGGQLTLGKAVPRVDVAVVDVHDVHTLVVHEVPLMPIALQGEYGSHLQAGALGKARTHHPLGLGSVVSPCSRGSHGLGDKAGIQPQNLAP